VRVVLIHIRDPQFYALPATTRAVNGRIRVMGFPPIGIMSLSAVLKRADVFYSIKQIRRRRMK